MLEYLLANTLFVAMGIGALCLIAFGLLNYRSARIDDQTLQASALGKKALNRYQVNTPSAEELSNPSHDLRAYSNNRKAAKPALKKVVGQSEAEPGDEVDSYLEPFDTSDLFKK